MSIDCVTLKELRVEAELEKAALKKRLSGVIFDSISEVRKELLKELWKLEKPAFVPRSCFNDFCEKLQERLEEDISEELS